MELDADLKFEVNKKLGKKRLASERGDPDFDEFKGEKTQRERNKEEQRKRELKRTYEKEKEKELTRRFANSSYLTPESITYLNQIIKSKQSNVD